MGKRGLLENGKVRESLLERDYKPLRLYENREKRIGLRAEV
jgi:hypothetical protein